MAKSAESGQRPGETTDVIPRVTQESGKEKSYQDIGQQRIDNAKNFLKTGLSGFADKIGRGLGWLAKKAEQGLAGALATPEMTIDAAKAAGRGAKSAAESISSTTVAGAKVIGRGAEAAGKATVDTAMAAGRGIKSAAETIGAGAIIGAVGAYEGGKMAAEAVGKGTKLAAERVSSTAVAGVRAVGRGAEAFGGAAVDVTKATGRGIKSAVETVGAGAIIGGGIALEAGKAAIEFAGDKYSQAKEAVFASAKDKYDRVSNSARSTYESAKGAVNSAVDKFNNWRNERRMNKAAELLGVNRAQVEKLQAFLSSIS